MDKIAGLYDYLGYMIGGLFAVICIIAFVRILMKSKRGETVHIEPIGVFQDLTDTVTGLGKMEEIRDE